jgi:hypothetical protein
MAQDDGVEIPGRFREWLLVAQRLRRAAIAHHGRTVTVTVIAVT